MFVLALALALAPPLLLLWFFRSHDKHPEPMGVVWTTFVLGVLTPIPVVLFALPAALAAGEAENALLNGAFAAFVTAAAPEEFCKLLVLRYYSATHRHFDERMDGIIYGTVASLGFATAENVLYVLQGGLGTGLLRAFTAIPMHGFLGVVMGYYVGEARFQPTRRANLYTKALLLPLLFHGLYDFPLLTMQVLAQQGKLGEEQAPLILGLVGMAVAALVALVAWAMLLLRRVRHEQHQLVVAEAVEG